MNTVFGFVHRRKISGKITEVEKPTKVVYRDELTKKQSVKKSVRFADSAPTILGEKDCEKSETSGNIRVKVKMTKEEAIRLLSKCREGGVLEFKDVARELVSIPVNRVSVLIDKD